MWLGVALALGVTFLLVRRRDAQVQLLDGIGSGLLGWYEARQRVASYSVVDVTIVAAAKALASNACGACTLFLGSSDALACLL